MRNIRKRLIVIASLLLSLHGVYAEKIQLNATHLAENSRKRMPCYTPSANIEGFCMFFDQSCVGCSVSICQNGVIVYTAVVGENMEVELPNYLAGQFELQLQRGSITYVGEFEL